jgi:hypothetical protein
MAADELGTFSCVFGVGDDRKAPMPGRMCDLAGVVLQQQDTHPVLEWAEYTPEPWKEYARVTLSVPATGNRTASKISFTVERGLMRALRPSDHVQVGAGPAIALTVVHDDFLVAAAGPADVLSQLPLGSEVRLRFPGEDLAARFLTQPEAIHYLGSSPPPPGHPYVEVIAAGERRIIPWGRPTLGPYEIFVRPSVRPEVPLISIERLKICPETSAHTTAQLLDRDGFQVHA